MFLFWININCFKFWRKCDSGDSAQSSLTQSTSSQIPPPKVSNLRNIQEYTISSDDESAETDHDENLHKW